MKSPNHTLDTHPTLNPDDPLDTSAHDSAASAPGFWAIVREDLAYHRDAYDLHTRFRTLFCIYFWLLFAFRLGAYARNHTNPLARKLLLLAYYPLNFFVSSVTGCDLQTGCVIGRRFMIHLGRAILIANGSVIGDDVTLNTQACIVNKANNRAEGCPRIGNDVLIGAGAKIMGRVTIGDHCVVGANAVVIADVPALHMAVGIPAKNRPMPAATPTSERP